MHVAVEYLPIINIFVVNQYMNIYNIYRYIYTIYLQKKTICIENIIEKILPTAWFSYREESLYTRVINNLAFLISYPLNIHMDKQDYQLHIHAM